MSSNIKVKKQWPTSIALSHMLGLWPLFIICCNVLYKIVASWQMSQSTTSTAAVISKQWKDKDITVAISSSFFFFFCNFFVCKVSGLECPIPKRMRTLINLSSFYIMLLGRIGAFSQQSCESRMPSAWVGNIKWQVPQALSFGVRNREQSLEIAVSAINLTFS